MPGQEKEGENLMKKRIVAGMLVSLMAASMVACGSSGSADTTADTSADKVFLLCLYLFIFLKLKWN